MSSPSYNEITEVLHEPAKDAEPFRKSNGAIMPAVPPGLPQTLAADPDVVLREAQRAAAALAGVMNSKKQKVIFNGEVYLQFEDWQTVARFYGVTAKIRAVKMVKYGEVTGFLAKADAILVSSGQVISAAEALCLNDEPKWKSRPKYESVKQQDGRWHRVKTGDEPVPLFQLRSMAQTRAAAKALRNVLAWVVVLAGYKPTPAEELDGMAEIQSRRGICNLCAEDLYFADEEKASLCRNCQKNRERREQHFSDKIQAQDFVKKSVEAIRAKREEYLRKADAGD